MLDNWGDECNGCAFIMYSIHYIRSTAHGKRRHHDMSHVTVVVPLALDAISSEKGDRRNTGASSAPEEAHIDVHNSDGLPYVVRLFFSTAACP